MATTPNLGLHQWQAGDSFLRTDFNTDFGKLDTAIGGQLKISSGVFTGDGTANREIAVGFKPKLLMVCSAVSERQDVDLLGEQCFLHIGSGGNVYGGIPSAAGYTLTANGFIIKWANGNTRNIAGYYIAFG